MLRDSGNYKNITHLVSKDDLNDGCGEEKQRGCHNMLSVMGVQIFTSKNVLNVGALFGDILLRFDNTSQELIHKGRPHFVV